jgi:putative copper export protein
MHVLGAGGWLGTLLALVLVGLPAALRAAEGARGTAAAALVEAFSPVALACAGVLAASGLAAAWWHVGRVGALWTSAYGRILLLKLAMLVVIAGMGAYNWRRVRPTLGDERSVHRVRASSSVELLIGAVVLAITAVLVAIPTPMDSLR